MDGAVERLRVGAPYCQGARSGAGRRPAFSRTTGSDALTCPIPFHVGGDIAIGSPKVRIKIAAPPAVVWAVLTDFSRYPRWNPMVTAAEGTAAGGSIATLHYRSSIGLPLRFRVRITRFEAERELRWIGRRLGVSGQHYFQRMADGSGTRFVHGEVFRGRLAGTLGLLFRGQLPVFEAFNRAPCSTWSAGTAST
jgi:hypothetical protein